MAKGVFEKLKDGLSIAKIAVESNVGGFVAASVDTLLAAGGVPPVLSGARSAMMKRDHADENAADDDADEKADGTNDGGSKSKVQATKAKSHPTKAEKATAALAHTSDGFGFYRVDRFLRAMTRPTHN